MCIVNQPEMRERGTGGHALRVFSAERWVLFFIKVGGERGGCTDGLAHAVANDISHTTS
jgi:hypothetical protein